MKKQIDQLITELGMLCKITWYEPQVVYSYLFSGFKHSAAYFMRTIPNISNQLNKTYEIVRTEFITAISGGINCIDIQRKLLSFPSTFGVLGIPIFSEIANRENDFSRMISKDVTTNVINKHRQYKSNANATDVKKKIKQTKLKHHQDELSKLQNNPDDSQRRFIELKLRSLMLVNHITNS